MIYCISQYLECKMSFAMYLFNCACLAIRFVAFDLREILLHDPSVTVAFCIHEVDTAVAFVSSSDKLSSAK